MAALFIPASTCYRKPYLEPARLSRASQCSGEAFTLECLRARGIIFTQVEISCCVITPFLRAAAAGFQDAFQPAIRARAPFACSFGQSVLTNQSRTRCTGSQRHAPLVFYGNHASIAPVTVTCLLLVQPIKRLSLHHPSDIWLSNQQYSSKTQCQLPRHCHDRFLLTPTTPQHPSEFL